MHCPFGATAHLFLRRSPPDAHSSRSGSGEQRRAVRRHARHHGSAGALAAASRACGSLAHHGARTLPRSGPRGSVAAGLCAAHSPRPSAFFLSLPLPGRQRRRQVRRSLVRHRPLRRTGRGCEALALFASLFRCPKFGIRDHFKRHAEPVPAAEEAGILLPVNRVQPQRLHMITFEIVEQGQLVSSHTSPGAIAPRLAKLLDLREPGVVSVLRAINEFTLLLCEQQSSEVAAIEGASRPRWRCWILYEDLPGDVGGDTGAAWSRLRATKVFVAMLPPVWASLRSTVTLLLAVAPSLPWGYGSRRVGRLDPDPDLVPAGVRPQHPGKADDRTGEPTASHTAVLGDGCEPVRRRTARQDRWRPHFHRGQPEPEFGDESVMALPVCYAFVWFACRIAFLRARLVAAKTRCVNRGRLPAHRPHFEFSVRKNEDDNDDEPSDPPRRGNMAAGQQWLEEGAAEVLNPRVNEFTSRCGPRPGALRHIG